MTEESFKRKLTAILSADVEGYSRLMGEDEDATIRTLTAYRELMSTLIQKHRGRVVDSPGDNLLAEFLSVVDAVRCAVEIQEELRVRNAELPENRRMEFRIGINLGDVVEEAERIYGDGINIAARVEGLAEGGGICISGTVYDSIKNKLTLSYESLGEHTVKNIKEPIRVYRMRVGPEVAVRPSPRRWQRAALAAVAVLVVAAGAWAIWNFYFRPPPIEPASVENMAYPLPDKPSIAVLPFKNLSGESKQEFLADGITESVIAAISRVSGLFVIASNSVFTYKGKPVKVQTVSEELGVQNVLEGTVQRAGNRIQITAQLIDATTGRHLWSEKYDRTMKDLFSVQDDIAKEILTSLQVKLLEGEQARVWARGTTNLEAYLKFLKAYDQFRSFSKNNMILTRQICEEATALDPNYEPAYSLSGVSHLIDLWFNWGESPRVSMEKSFTSLQKAVELNPASDFAYANLCHLYLMQKRFDESVAAGEKSIALNPNGDYNMVLLGITFNYIRRYEEAITLFKEAQRRNPYCPAWYIHNMGNSYRGLGRWDEAIAECQRALDRNPDHFPALVVMASVYGMAERIDEGQSVVEKILKINPRYSIGKISLPFKYKSDEEAIRDGLRKAGLQDKPPLPLPDKPSIAVLPFVNMSGDPEQEYFSDGITEEIITALSKTPKLFVIARNSSFVYKGKAVNVQKVGRELGVKYVLEGSVRKSGNQLRITAQLIDATTGNHLWAERYDRNLIDVFALQDEITKEIITAMQVKLSRGDAEHLYAKGTHNLEAYLKCLQARELLLGAMTKKKNVLARRLAQEAIDLDPNYSEAYRELAQTYVYEVYIRTTKSPRESLERAAVLIQKGIALDNSNAHAYSLLAEIYLKLRQYDKSVAAVEHAFALEPNSPQILYRYGRVLYTVGRWEEALPYFEEAMRLNPIPPNILLRRYGALLRELERYDEATAVFKRAIEQEPERNLWAYLMLAVTYSLEGREDDARETAKEVLRINPKFSVKFMEKIITFKNPAHTKRLTTAMRKAGLPD